jgi:hypothetical protein
MDLLAHRRSGQRTTLAALVLTATVLTACGSPPPPPQPQALTEFPNLDHFTAVDAASYDPAEHTGSTVQFKSGDGLFCSMNAGTGMGCSIPFAVPGIDGGQNDGGCTWAEPSTTPDDPHPYEFKREDLPCPSGDSYKLLPDESKVAYAADGVTHFTCATGKPGFVACIDDQKHGFVLQKDKSWVF